MVTPSAFAVFTFTTSSNPARVLEQERFAAYVHGDVAVLDRIFADDLVYFHSNGLSDPKSGVLQSFASGDLKISCFEAEDLQVREIGNVMVATGLVQARYITAAPALRFSNRTATRRLCVTLS